MYGYVRPEKGELKVREYETFRGVYCGLCHTLKKRWGPAFRFAVNYDFTFLAMLLAEPEAEETCFRRCPYHPFRRTECPRISPAMEAAADYSVILAYWKMRDGAEDKSFFPALGCRILAAFVRPYYKKAAELRPGFARAAEDNLRQLMALERECCPSLDRSADKFAMILSETAEGVGDSSRARILHELLYHLGRIVYILDAVDDLEDDMKSGSYNPLRYRFSLSEGKLSEEDEAELRRSMQYSHNSISAAFELLKSNAYTSILSNIIYYGLPAVTQSVFSGTWRAAAKDRRKGNRL